MECGNLVLRWEAKSTPTARLDSASIFVGCAHLSVGGLQPAACSPSIREACCHLACIVHLDGGHYFVKDAVSDRQWERPGRRRERGRIHGLDVGNDCVSYVFRNQFHQLAAPPRFFSVSDRIPIFRNYCRHCLAALLLPVRYTRIERLLRPSDIRPRRAFPVSLFRGDRKVCEHRDARLQVETGRSSLSELSAFAIDPRTV